MAVVRAFLQGVGAAAGPRVRRIGFITVVGLAVRCAPSPLEGGATVCRSVAARSRPPDAGGEASTPIPARIGEIQGAGHRSPFEGRHVQVAGVVTVVRDDGFYLQSATSDADLATSEGVFVATSEAAWVIAGDQVTVTGPVVETRPGCSRCSPDEAASDYLTLTEIAPAHSVRVESPARRLPEPIVIGVAGRRPPAQRIDSGPGGDVEVALPDEFDACGDAIDFYESLEHMLVQVDDARSVGPTTPSGEIAVVGDGGHYAAEMTARGGIVVRPGDANPERILIDDAILPPAPSVDVGAWFVEPIVGVMDYTLGNFKLFNTAPLMVEGANDLRSEQLELGEPAADELDVATLNVENLSAQDPEERFDGLAEIIVNALKSPDVLLLQEVQDDSGATDDGIVTSRDTLESLVRAIETVGGPPYHFADIAPMDGADGGQPGGNIRVAFMVSPRRGATLVLRAGATANVANQIVVADARAHLLFSPGRVDPTNAAFINGRKPLAAEISFRGRTLVVIANHFRSKGSDEPLYGRWQPPTLVSEATRQAEARVVARFAKALTDADPTVTVLAAGDFNDFDFSRTLGILEDAVLVNAARSLPTSDRYTYVFEGNSQALDHVLLSERAAEGGFEYDIVHVNAEFHDGRSDHDPIVLRLHFE